MVIEIPVFKRACFCLPLRHGILIFGYLNLVVAICYFGVEGMLGFHRGVPIPAPMWFFFMLYGTEIIFGVVLVVGAHKKICTLLNAFFYYSLSTTLAAFICLLVVWAIFYEKLFQREFHLDLAFAFGSSVVHIYLLLLIRSELKKLRNPTSHIVVNHMSEVVIRQPTGEGRNSL